MARIAIVGDGPAGLSAALFLGKNGHEVVVLGRDETAMHYAQLHNYLGIDDITGTELQARARAQVAAQGVELRDREVTEVVVRDEGFVVRSAETVDDGTTAERDTATEAGASEAEEVAADYVVLAGGKPVQRLAVAAGADVEHGHVRVDVEQRTSVDRLYAVGRVARPERSQAIISAGAGAVAALDVLSREAGRDVHDWDSPPEG